MNQVNLDLKSFVNLLENDKNDKLNHWRDLIPIYNNTLGGCNCSRKSREAGALATFISKINDTNTNKPELIQELKQVLNTEKIFFIYKEGTVFLEV